MLISHGVENSPEVRYQPMVVFSAGHVFCCDFNELTYTVQPELLTVNNSTDFVKNYPN